MTTLSRAQILALFEALNTKLAERGSTGELYVVGGAVLCLVHRARESTRDVDAVFEPKSVVRELARDVADDFGLPTDWLNDGVKGFMSAEADFDDFLELSNLRILTASPEYLFAMKAIAMRLGAEFHDEDDVRFLLRYLGVQTYDGAIEILDRYYPRELVPQKTLCAVEEIAEGLAQSEG